MDIAMLSMNLSQMNVAQAASISVLKLAQENAMQQSQELVKALELSVQPHLGSTLDIKA